MYEVHPLGSQFMASLTNFKQMDIKYATPNDNTKNHTAEAKVSYKFYLLNFPKKERKKGGEEKKCTM